MRVYANRARRGERGGYTICFDAENGRTALVALSGQVGSLGHSLDGEWVSEFVREHNSQGLPVWVGINANGAVAFAEPPGEDADLLEMPWGIILGGRDAEVVRHQLFEDDATVTVPSVFTTTNDYEVWVDEAARRSNGIAALADAIRNNDVLRRRVTTAIGGLDDDGTRRSALGSVLFGESDQTARSDEDRRPNEPPGGGNQADRPARSDADQQAAGTRNAAEHGEGDGGSGTRRRDATPELDGEPQDVANFVIEGPLGTLRGDKTRAAANISAIECMVEIGNNPATPEQQEVLAEYVGWGGLPGIFDESKDEWQAERGQLKELTSEQEYAAMRASTLNAHYTSVPVVNALWNALTSAGYDGKGDVLEPSCGTGHFIGAGPVEQNVTGVEIDPFTARIASKLYPQARILNTGFENAEIGLEPEFDVAVGNPPFGTDRLYDQNHKDLSHHSIHNYFIAKSLRAVKPGGMAAFVVSRYFLDAGNDKTRQLVHQMADFVAAVRLPDTAFARNAGSNVVTDLVVFRKRLAHEQVPDPTNLDWLHTDKQWDEKADTSHNINRFITKNPDFVIGEPSYDGAMFRGSCYTVRTDIPVDDQAGVGAEAERRLVYQVRGQVREHGNQLYAPQDDPARQRMRGELPALDDLNPTALQRKMGGLVMHDDGEIYAIKADPDTLRMTLVEKHQPRNGADDRRLRALLSIRDKTRQLLAQEANPKCNVVEMTQTRDGLRKEVVEFIDTFGGAYNGNKNAALLRDEPDRHLVLSLHDSETATHAALLERRVNNHDHVLAKPKTVQDALAVSYSERGLLDIEYIADALDMNAADVENELLDLGLAFRNPEDGSLSNADEYLSGNVRRKLAIAQEAVEADESFKRNVMNLEQVLPADIPAEDIFVQMQSPWLPADVLSDFMEEHAGIVVDCVRFGADKAIRADKARWQNTNLEAVQNNNEEVHGTRRMPAVRIMERLSNGQQIAVYDRVFVDGKDRQVLNAEETAKAQLKAENLQAAFKSWVWKDHERATHLEKSYNEIMNSHVTRKYDGSFLRFRGMATQEINLRKNQRDAAWRMVCQERTLVDHAVGAGKTYTALAAEMEKQNMGLINKSMFVVPNHLVGQWAQEAQRLYPGAAVLTMEPGTFTRDKRREFLARVATGDWQAIICPHSVFGLIETSREWQLEMLADEEAALERTIEDIYDIQERDRGDNLAARRLSVKQVEKKRKALQRKIAELQSKPHNEHLLAWEQLGIDSLVIDEAQEFKNLRYESNHRNLGGLGPPKGSKKAFDLFSKIRWMDRKEGRTTVTFLSGTPISNTVAEAYHVMNYLAPDALNERGCDSMDLWLRTFAEIAPNYETTVTGIGFKKKTRVRSFNNLPELCTIYGGFADVVTNEDLDREHLKETGKPWPIPKIKGDEPKKHILAKSPYLEALFENIVERMKEIEDRKVDSTVDNPLKCLHDARTNALDARIQAEKEVPYDDQCKVEAVAREIVRIHAETDAVKGCQLVFCDLSTPKQFRAEESREIEALAKQAAQGDAQAVNELESMQRHGMDGDFDVYNELRRRVIELSDGKIGADEFAFIHEAGTSMNKRNKLFDRARQGDIRVLMGSTSKMGTGMNVQDRLVALHHMDVPWRPADLEQREGRILRQGNMLMEDDPNFAVEIHRYGTQATSDAKSWDILAIKAAFILAFRKGNVGASEREMEDIGDGILSYNEMKALTADNPLILEELNLTTQVRTLEREERSYSAQQRRYKEIASKLSNHEVESKREIARCKKLVKAYEKAPFVMEVKNGAKIEMPKEKDDGETENAFNARRSALRDQMGQTLTTMFANQAASQSFTPEPSEAVYKDFTVSFQGTGAPMHSASSQLRSVEVDVGTKDGRHVKTITYFGGTTSSFSAQGFMARFDNIFKHDLPHHIDNCFADIPKNEKALQEANEKLGEAFPKADELAQTKKRLHHVRLELSKVQEASTDRSGREMVSAARAA